MLGIDVGHSLIKAAVFDEHGTTVGVATRATSQSSPHPTWREQDMDATWEHVAATVREAVRDSGVEPAHVAGVGVSGHGDGLYLVDEILRPVRPAILATDVRATELSTKIASTDVRSILLETGQRPAAYSTASLLAWLQHHEPESIARSRWILHCKDWIRLCLTGTIGTDPTDAAGMSNLATGRWSTDALARYGLAPCGSRLPSIRPSDTLAGSVTIQAASLTGLAVDTPVVVGCHDVHAAALGIGALEEGSLSAVIGTFNINQLSTRTPAAHADRQVRRSLCPGAYLEVSSSAAGAIAMEWVRDVTGLAATDVGTAVTEALRPPPDVHDPLFVPFLYGGPPEMPINGALFDLNGWTSSINLLRAGLEGVVYAHRFHLETLTRSSRTAHPGRRLRLTGGGSRNHEWAQLFADVTGYDVDITDTEQAGARGAAMLAGIGVGQFLDHDDAVGQWVTVVRHHPPSEALGELHDKRYHRWKAALTALRDLPTCP